MISATHVALRSAVEAGRFREDLMYRVRVIPLFLPRLAEREGDVEMLAWRFLDELAAAGYRKITTMERRAHEALLAHPWPGNVRELRNVIEYASAVGDGDVLRLADLTPELRGERPAKTRTGSLAETERQRLLQALAAAGGRRGLAAEALGIDRSTLWRKLREHGLTAQRSD